MDTRRVRITLSLVAMILAIGSAWLAAMPGAEAVRDAPAAASVKVLEGHVYEIVPGRLYLCHGHVHRWHGDDSQLDTIHVRWPQRDSDRQQLLG
ncbi:MAG: hypothetical protein H5T64_03760 [Chloroflexi bacterium]|nr:hypothetical protein [Chloroflexota bacterium]